MPGDCIVCFSKNDVYTVITLYYIEYIIQKCVTIHIYYRLVGELNQEVLK